MTPPISVVIPCRNAEKTLGTCLASLKRQSHAPHEIIVVDDASSDGTAGILREAGVSVVSRSEWGGAGVARSQGAARATGDIIAFLDSDCWAPDDWLEKILGAFDRDATLGGIGGKYTHQRASSLLGNLVRCEEEYIHHVFSRYPETVNPAGGNVAFRKSLWDKGRTGRELAHFRRMGSGEDSVVHSDLRRAGKIRYDYSLEVFHHPCDGSRYFKRHLNRGISRSTIELKALSDEVDARLVLEAHGGWPLFLGSLSLAAVFGALAFLPLHVAWGAAALSLLAHFVLTSRFFAFVRRLNPKGGASSGLKPGWTLAFRMILLLRSLCWIAGAAVGFFRHLRFQSSRSWNILASIAHFWRPGRISKLFFFVTSRCNARCSFCFNLENVEGWKERQPHELTLDEVRKIAGKFGRLPYLTLSGGEPFIRRDLPDLVEAFHRESKTQWVTIPSNGGLTRETVDSTLAILQRCPGIFLTVQISIDSMAEEHDRSRKLKDGFKKLTETLIELSRFRRHYPHLRVQIATCYGEFNRHRLEELIRYCRENFEFDQQMFYLLRDANRRVTRGNDRFVPDYLDLVFRNGDREWATHRRSLWGRAVRALQAANYLDIAEITRNDTYLRPCHATQKFATLYDDGAITPCEVLEKVKLGNVREFDFDYYALKRARAVADYHRDKIVGEKCSCDWACGAAVNILYDPRTLPRVVGMLVNPGKGPLKRATREA